MTYSQSYYQPSVLAMARQGNFRAIGYWINSILAPQGIYIQTETTRSGSLRILVNFRRTSNRSTCMNARQQIVRHICYRLWTLNSAAIREVKIIGRVAGRNGILWQQSVRINTPANSARPYDRQQSIHQPYDRQQSIRQHQIRSQRAHHSRSASKPEFQLLRSFLVNRLALVGFIFCYWILYLESTGYQFGEPTNLTAASAQELVQTNGQAQKSAKTTITHVSQSQRQNIAFTVPPQFQGQVVYEATPPAGAQKVVALTFDDGPWTTTTEQILDILQKNSIKATFYWVGKALQENTDIAKKVVAQGHAIGNHTWKHLMDNMDELTAAEELGNNAKLIYQTTGVRTALMRPPGGNLGGELVNYAKKQGYMSTLWSVDSNDYLVSTPLIIDNVLANVKPGGIVLMHDGGGDRSATVEALPQIITSLQRQGYKFVTVPELMNMQAQWGAIKPPGSVEPGPSPSASPSVSPSASPPASSSTDAGQTQAPGSTLQPTTSPPAETTPQPDSSPPSTVSPQTNPTSQTDTIPPSTQGPQPGVSQPNAEPQTISSPPIDDHPQPGNSPVR